RMALALADVIVVAAALVFWRQTRRGTPQSGAASAATVQQVKAGDLQIALLSPTGALRRGRNALTIEFRSVDGKLVDVGTVRASANMRMPGMEMSGGLQVHRTYVPGRFDATAEFGMAGAWAMTHDW